MKKEIPILFSTPMVEALIAGRKTQTRRVVKQRISYEANKPGETRLTAFGVLDKNGNYIEIEEGEPCTLADGFCPYGKPGDILYVRESWKLVAWDFEDGTATIEYANGDKVECLMGGDSYDEQAQEWTVRQVDKLEDKGILKRDPEDEERFEFAEGAKHPFSPSIHLPKWCSRIWLEVVDVRVERLQDISREDAVAEGIAEVTKDGKLMKYCVYDHKDYSSTPWSEMRRTSKAAYLDLWEKINGRESWDANPWVFVVEFKVLSTNGKPA